MGSSYIRDISIHAKLTSRYLLHLESWHIRMVAYHATLIHCSLKYSLAIGIVLLVPFSVKIALTSARYHTDLLGHI
jgi:hypothetical protein